MYHMTSREEQQEFGTGYQPKDPQVKILRRAFEMVESVPYQVSARWLFYMMLQEGTYTDKDAYKSQFLPLLAKARKAFFEGWRPDTLADDTRRAIVRGNGYDNEMQWLQAMGQWQGLDLDKWLNQDYYVELWFEAKAMIGQFEHYTQHITLRPFGGDPSIPYKWTIAKELEKRAEWYGKPIVILYFGDLDPKGLTIPQSAAEDIQKWCRVEFEFIRAGLNPGDEDRYHIMENPDKPGAYQWEALNDDTAGEVINRAVGRYIDPERYVAIAEKEKRATARFRQQWQKFLQTYEGAEE